MCMVFKYNALIHVSIRKIYASADGIYRNGKPFCLHLLSFACGAESQNKWAKMQWLTTSKIKRKNENKKQKGRKSLWTRGITVCHTKIMGKNTNSQMTVSSAPLYKVLSWLVPWVDSQLRKFASFSINKNKNKKLTKLIKLNKNSLSTKYLTDAVCTLYRVMLHISIQSGNKTRKKHVQIHSAHTYMYKMNNAVRWVDTHSTHT